jgi:DNA-binding transcriptional ArsR family regulator
MSRRSFSSIAALINDLIDRYERGGGTTRPSAGIDNEGFPTVDQRDTFDDELASLERDGGVELVRSGPRAERVVTGARLKDANVLYRHAGRRPSAQLADETLAELRARGDLPEGAGALINAAARAWARGVSHLGIAKGDVRALGHVIQLSAAVQSRLSEPEDSEIDYRTFSRLAVGDSKSLERNVRQVASVIPRLFPSGGSRSGRNPDELLAEAGIVRMPQPVLIRGSLTLDGQTLPELPFVGLPTECAGIVDLRQRPGYVLMIENYASFVRHVREVSRTDDGLVIYSGGFPSHPTLRAIARLAAQAEAPTFHWGDMDAGGVRIFRHIERHLAPLGVTLRPHMMDADLLRRTGTVATGAPDVVGDMTGSAVSDLARAIRETGLVHEQEEFSPRSPLAGGQAGADDA